MRSPLRIAVAGVLLALLGAQSAAAAPGDRDGDGLPDRWERRHGLTAKQAGANGDPDRDRVDNRNEFRQRTNPRRRDSDGDRTSDGSEDADGDRLGNAAEDASGQDPTKPDSDHDGVLDGDENAGVVTSFSDGRLTIALATGGSVRARVTDDTDIGCGTEDDAELLQELGPARHRDDDGELTEADPQHDVPDDTTAPDPSPAEEDGHDEDADDDGAGAGAGAHGDSEFQDDEHDFEDACPARRLRAGVPIREAALRQEDGVAVFDEVERLRRR